MIEVLTGIILFITIQFVFWVLFSFADVQTLSDAKRNLKKLGIVVYYLLTFSFHILIKIFESLEKLMKKLLLK